MPPETSADRVDFMEQSARVPMAATASKDKHALKVLIFLL
jgi:hypothetical protein